MQNSRDSGERRNKESGGNGRTNADQTDLKGTLEVGS